MGTIGVLGAGSWGTALAVHLARVGHEVRLWARRCRVGRRDARAAHQCRLSRGCDAARCAFRHQRHRRRGGRQRSHRVGCSVARLSIRDARGRAAHRGGRHDRQRHERPGEWDVALHVGSRGSRARSGPTGGRVVGTEFRRRSRQAAADGRARGFRRTSARPSSCRPSFAGRISDSTAAPTSSASRSAGR